MTALALLQVALDPTAPTSDLVAAFASVWGQWPVVWGIAVVLLVRALLVAQPLYLDRIPSRLRPLVAIALAGLPAFGVALAAGYGVGPAFVALLTAWASATGATEALRLAIGKPGEGEGGP